MRKLIACLSLLLISCSLFAVDPKLLTVTVGVTPQTFVKIVAGGTTVTLANFDSVASVSSSGLATGQANATALNLVIRTNENISSIMCSATPMKNGDNFMKYGIVIGSSSPVNITNAASAAIAMTGTSDLTGAMRIISRTFSLFAYASGDEANKIYGTGTAPAGEYVATLTFTVTSA